MAQPSFQQVCKAFMNIPEFPSGFYMERLDNKIRSLPAINSVFNNVADDEARAVMARITALFSAQHISKELTKSGLPQLKDFSIGDQYASRQVLIVWASHLLNTPGVTLEMAFSDATRIVSAVVAPVSTEGKAAHRQNIERSLVLDVSLPLANLNATQDDFKETGLSTFDSAASLNMDIWETTVRGKWTGPVTSEATHQTSSQHTKTQKPSLAIY
ncbi:uncharacterized protein J7T54_005712 [Emericellopsis cladophorae]|uniref:Uncharacterized protein n=1 Tax=Emericellopsis cladophorae TaxID=2686198 RepID=A0A9P9Y5Y4_9HYPO|nr:uncharacterized protein J7T54_005712 [Emericellopsis cladophorae]KAI6783683.1 hypothetical protein J7T54_005712 [Emericellopsis cladophorae]